LSRTAESWQRLPLAADLIGIGLVIGAVFWTFRTATPGSDPRPVVQLLLLSLAAFIAARLAARADRSIAPAIIILWALFVVVQFPRSILSAAPMGLPFGYANAKGSFFALTTVAALMLMFRGPRFMRPVAAAAAGAAAIVPFVSHTYAAAVLAVTLPLLTLGVGWVFSWRAAVLGCAVLFLFAFGTTLFVGAVHEEGGNPGFIETEATALLTPRRVILWSEAIDLMVRNPATGVGPGRFRNESPTAISDTDAQWAHNGFLQQGAEQGILGMALAVAIFIWAFARLSIRPGLLSALGAAAVAILGIHASIDYVLHFGILPMAAAAIVGTSSARPPQEYEFAPTEWEAQARDVEDSLARSEGY
jgi:O-antigen ligase